MKRFDVHFDPANRHRVTVVLHPTRAALRRIRRFAADADAFCWRCYNSKRTGIVAEIHLAMSILTVADIAHEATHASIHRAAVIGLTPGTDPHEEQVATDTGTVTDAIVEGLTNLGIEVKVFTKRK